MAFVVRHLTGPLLLLVALSVALLVMDGASRGKRDKPHVAIVQTSSNPVMEEGVKGILQGLASQGFEDGKNIRVVRFNAENDISTANMIGTQIANDQYDLVVTAGTQMLQAVANANKTRQSRHVFCLVTDPVASGVGIGPEPLQHPAHLVGYGSKPPVRRGFDLLLAMNPNARRLGVAFNPAEINSVVTVETARAEAKNLGLELIEVAVDNSSAVKEAVASLLNKDLDAFFVGGDVTVITAFDAVVEVTSRARIPVFSVVPGYVKRGVFFEVGADYVAVGELAGSLGGEVLKGRKIPEIEWKNLIPEVINVNTHLAPKFKGTWKFDTPLADQGHADHGHADHGQAGHVRPGPSAGVKTGRGPS